MEQISPARVSAVVQNLSDAVPAALAMLGDGWEILRDCPLGGGGRRLNFVLLHWRFGVVLLSDKAFARGETRPEERLRRALEGARFPAIFGGWPSILSLAVPPGASAAEIARAVSAGLARSAPMTLPGGDAWLGTARRAAESDASTPAASPRLTPGRVRGRRGGWGSKAAAAGVVGLGCAGVLAYALLASAGQDAAPTEARRGAQNGTASALPAPPPPEAPRAEVDPPAAAAPPRLADSGPPDPAPDVKAVLGLVPPDLAAVEAPAASPTALPAAAATKEHVPPAVPFAPVKSGIDAAPEQRGAPPRPEPRPKRSATGGGVASATPAAKAGPSRCASILAKVQLGEPLADEDRRHLRHGC